MIEVIYKEDTTEQETAQESFSMPRNVRQIGLANGDYRIYIEDYVYTFSAAWQKMKSRKAREKQRYLQVKFNGLQI